MSTFTSPHGDQSVRVYPDVQNVFVLYAHDRLNANSEACVTLAASDAPALALAILESAGAGGSAVAHNLREYITATDAAAKEAAELHKLHAEARELHEVYKKTPWGGDAFMALALKARELHATEAAK